MILASKAPISWWSWAGGLIVVMNIVTFIISPAKIGAGTMVILFIAAQLISSMIFEHFGLLNFISTLLPGNGWLVSYR